MNGGKHFGKGSAFPTFPEDDKQLRLISARFCPYGHRVHLVLDSKNVPYHTLYCNLTDKPEWLLEKSPLGKVPALELPNEDGCPVIMDSLAICEYLDEKYPQNPLLPRDPLKKLQEKNLAEKLGVAAMPAAFKLFVMGPIKSPGCIEEMEEAIKVFEDELENRKTPYFGGDKPGWVDYMIWPWFERLAMVKYVYGESHDLDYAKLKNLAKWIELMKEDAAVKLMYLDGETHAKFVKTKQAGNPDYDMLVKQ
ncbi:pyrimidodiazepine synthase-like [Eupeodes corollae]|uniref:pyrimidodiazepine synthase-like n=1 Tax=Eupeodes corollae TaxID=290404 RepID=UPI00248FDDE6|nr:pyrimidodiazepine synthase-like [Eupeodes corollae]